MYQTGHLLCGGIIEFRFETILKNHRLCGVMIGEENRTERKNRQDVLK
jgi:hypothetical protein